MTTKKEEVSSLLQLTKVRNKRKDTLTSKIWQIKMVPMERWQVEGVKAAFYAVLGSVSAYSAKETFAIRSLGQVTGFLGILTIICGYEAVIHAYKSYRLKRATRR